MNSRFLLFILFFMSNNLFSMDNKLTLHKKNKKNTSQILNTSQESENNLVWNNENVYNRRRLSCGACCAACIFCCILPAYCNDKYQIMKCEQFNSSMDQWELNSDFLNSYDFKKFYNQLDLQKYWFLLNNYPENQDRYRDVCAFKLIRELSYDIPGPEQVTMEENDREEKCHMLNELYKHESKRFKTIMKILHDNYSGERFYGKDFSTQAIHQDNIWKINQLLKKLNCVRKEKID